MDWVSHRLEHAFESGCAQDPLKLVCRSLLLLIHVLTRVLARTLY